MGQAWCVERQKYMNTLKSLYYEFEFQSDGFPWIAFEFYGT